METLFDQISQLLGTTLLHSLWQVLVVYALLRIFLAVFPSVSSAGKYNAGLLALAASVIWPLISFIIAISHHTFTQPVADLPAGDDILPFIPLHRVAVAHTETAATSFSLDSYLPYIVAFWMVGMALNSARLLWGWKNLYQIRQSVTSSPVLERSIEKLLSILNINQKVRVFVSEYVDVPCIVGYLKPMIILPVAVVTQFSAEQIRSILIHELAHIRRNDYFVNVLQQIVSILFFFNPFTHLINRIINTERENCCDDTVLQVTGQPLIYAQTLLQLEEARSQNYQLALAATGKKYFLLTRIKRIMESKKQVNNVRHILAAVLLLIGSMSTIAWLNPEIKDGAITVKSVNLTNLLNTVSDTTKKPVKPKKPAAAKKAAPAPKAVVPPVKAPKANISLSQYDDPKLNKLVAEVDKHAEAIGKYYESAAYKNLEMAMNQHSAIIDSFYKRPELKQAQEQLDQQSETFNKMADNPEMKQLEKQMEDLGKSMENYYKTDEYKNLTKAMDLQSKLLSEQSGNKEEYAKQREAYKQIADQLKAYSNNPQFKKEQDDMRAMGKKMHEYYNSDSYQAQRKAINEASAQLRKLYQSPMIKDQTAEMKKIGEEMRAYANAPQMKLQKEELKKAEAALNAYRNSPEFKKHQQKIEAEVKQLMKDTKPTPVADTTSSGK